jgi:hypothetical protein
MSMSTKSRRYILFSILIIVVTGIAIYLMGHPLICKCGYIKLWHGQVISSENSQHISDWYTFSHIIHGLIFYFIAWLFAKLFKLRFNIWAGLLFAVALESAWEILENTPLIVNRYREATIALDYFGDSVLNSICDIGAMALGYFIANKSKVWVSIALILIMELGVGYFIRDNLTLNVIMLIAPNDAIKEWQQGL